ncbi:response regulator [Desulfosoma sp.]
MKTILIVDDDPWQIRSLKIGLQNKGYHVIVASDGQEALHHVEEASDQPETVIDVVVTDYSMPGKNGMDLLRRIREKMPTLPVILMTAYGEKALVVEALRHQCDGFLEKPFPLDELIREMERAIHHRARSANGNDLKKLLPKIVHQINNPLMAITANAELAVRHLADDEKIKRRFQSILEAVEKIKTLNSRIMQLGAVAHHSPCDVVNLLDVMKEAQNMFEGLMSIKNIALEKEGWEEELYVNGSKNDLEQVFNNLILNAIEAMEDSPRKILKVSAHADREKQSVVIRVADTGCGIPEDQRDHIFNPFYTCKKGGNVRWTPLSRQRLEKFKVLSRFSALPLPVPFLPMVSVRVSGFSI